MDMNASDEEKPCPWSSRAAGVPLVALSGMNKSIPSVPEYSFTFQFEKNFDRDKAVKWIYQNYHWSIIYAVVYLACIYAVKAYMRNRPAFDLKAVLAAWNIFLAIFSILGTIRVVPEFYYVLTNFGFKYSMCNYSVFFDSPITAYWVSRFVLSKTVELFDTAFIVLRKQRLSFLHWFHHSTVLVWSWFLVLDKVAMGRWFMNMNYSVHAMMYTYYAFRSFNFKVPMKIAMTVTCAQILQMLVGFYISIRGYMMWYSGDTECSITGRIANVSIAMYSFYFLLFLHYFRHAYISQSHRKTKKVE